MKLMGYFYPFLIGIDIVLYRWWMVSDIYYYFTFDSSSYVMHLADSISAYRDSPETWSLGTQAASHFTEWQEQWQLSNKLVQVLDYNNEIVNRLLDFGLIMRNQIR